MLLLTCLVNLVFYAIIALFTLWLLGYILGMFIPGFPGLWPGTPGTPIVSLVYLLIGLILLLNFLICFMGGGHGGILPELWMGVR
jgi:hypothetical protein